MSHTYLVSWDMLGMETLIDYTAIEQNKVAAILKGEKSVHRNPLQFMILRAQANPQRHYEIYVFNSDVDEVSLREAFEDNPQMMADLIRERGQSVFSNRKNYDNVVIR